MLVYDVTDLRSKESVVEWTEIIKKNVDHDIELLLIGNKIDLVEERMIPPQEGENLSKEFNFPFIETSAKTGKNVNQAFFNIINKIVNKMIIKQMKTLETEPNNINTNRDTVDPIPLNKPNESNPKISIKEDKKHKKPNTTSCCCK